MPPDKRHKLTVSPPRQRGKAVAGFPAPRKPGRSKRAAKSDPVRATQGRKFEPKLWPIVLLEGPFTRAQLASFKSAAKEPPANGAAEETEADDINLSELLGTAYAPALCACVPRHDVAFTGGSLIRRDMPLVQER